MPTHAATRAGPGDTTCRGGFQPRPSETAPPYFAPRLQLQCPPRPPHSPRCCCGTRLADLGAQQRAQNHGAAIAAARPGWPRAAPGATCCEQAHGRRRMWIIPFRELAPTDGALRHAPAPPAPHERGGRSRCSSNCRARQLPPTRLQRLVVPHRGGLGSPLCEGPLARSALGRLRPCATSSCRACGTVALQLSVLRSRAPRYSRRTTKRGMGKREVHRWLDVGCVVKSSFFFENIFPIFPLGSPHGHLHPHTSASWFS